MATSYSSPAPAGETNTTQFSREIADALAANGINITSGTDISVTAVEQNFTTQAVRNEYITNVTNYANAGVDVAQSIAFVGKAVQYQDIGLNNDPILGGSKNFVYDTVGKRLTVTNLTVTGNINAKIENSQIANPNDAVDNSILFAGDDGYMTGTGNAILVDHATNGAELTLFGTNSFVAAPLIIASQRLNVNGSANITGILTAENQIISNSTQPIRTYGGLYSIDNDIFIGNTVSGAPTVNARWTSTGNITTKNATLGNSAVANYFTGNLYGTANIALQAGNVTVAAQPNITSVGSLTTLAVTGATTLSGTVTVAGAITAQDGIVVSSGKVLDGNVSGNITGATATFTGNVSANNIAIGNILTAGNLDANLITLDDSFFLGNGTANIIANRANVIVNVDTTEIGGTNLKSYGTLYVGTKADVTDTPAAASYTKISRGNIEAGGNITAANMNGGNLVTSNFFHGVLDSTSSAQPNVTSVGTLTGLTVAAGGTVTLSGAASAVQGANLVSASYLTGTLTTAAQPNITSVGELTSLVVAGNLTPKTNSSLFLGNASYKFANIHVDHVHGVIETAAQPNVTSLGTLSSLTVTGAVTLNGGVTTTAATVTGDIAVNGGDITTSATDFNVTPSANVNLSGLAYKTTVKGDLAVDKNTSMTGTLSVGGVMTVTGAITGNLHGTSNIALEVANQAQPNITSVGTLNYLTISNDSGNGILDVTDGTIDANVANLSYLNLKTGGNVDFSLMTDISSLKLSGVTLANVGKYLSVVNPGSGAQLGWDEFTLDTITTGSGATQIAAKITSSSSSFDVIFGGVTKTTSTSNGSFLVSGTTTISDPTAATSNVYISSGNITMTGDLTLSSGNANIVGNASVSANLLIGDATTNVTIGSGNITVKNDVTVGDKLNVTGTTVIGSSTSNVTMATGVITAPTASFANASFDGTNVSISATSHVMSVSIPATFGNTLIVNASSNLYLRAGAVDKINLESSSGNGTFAGKITGANGIALTDGVGGTSAFSVSQTGDATLAGNIAVTGNISAAQITATTFVGSISSAVTAGTAGTVTAAAQANITSVGTLTSLTVTGDYTSAAGNINLTAGNASVGGNLVVTGATTLTGDLAVNGGDITSTSATLNVGASGNTVAMLGMLTVAQGTTLTGDLAVNGGDITSTSATLNVGASGNTVALLGALTVAQGTTLTGDLGVNGGDITTTATTLNIAASANVALSMAGKKTNIMGNLSVAEDATFSGDIALNGGDLTSTNLSVSVFNTTSTTVNIAGAATALNMGYASGTTTISGALVLPQLLGTAPASASDTGTAGEVRVAGGFIYVCTATNTWVRAAIATW